MLFRSDRKSTRLNSSHTIISYAVFCLKKKKESVSPDFITSRAASHLPPRVAVSATHAIAWRREGSGRWQVVLWPILSVFFFFKERAPPEIPLFSPPPPFPT